jgi:hypothetical protein
MPPQRVTVEGVPRSASSELKQSTGRPGTLGCVSEWSWAPRRTQVYPTATQITTMLEGATSNAVAVAPSLIASCRQPPPAAPEQTRRGNPAEAARIAERALEPAEVENCDTVWKYVFRDADGNETGVGGGLMAPDRPAPLARPASPRTVHA